MSHPRAITLSAVVFLSWAVLPARAQALPEGPGKSEIVRVCGACHVPESTSRELSRRQSGDDWSKVLFKMLDFGADMNKEQQALILSYLTNNFGLGTPVKVAPKININTATAKDFVTVLALTTTAAEAAVHYREAHGNFKDWSDLSKVEGVDAKKIDAAKDQILTEDLPTTPAAVSPRP